MRSRDLHPNFFTSEELAAADAFGGLLRLAYEGLWCVADREGRFVWIPGRLKAQILPFDNVSFAAILDALDAGGWALSYVVNGVRYGWIPTFRSHQHVHPREAQSKIPPHPDDSGEPGAGSGAPKVDPRPPKVVPGKEKSPGGSGLSGPSDTQDLQGTNHIPARAKLGHLKAQLPDTCHESLDRVLAESGRGADGAVQSMLQMLDPNDGTTGPNGRPVTPTELGTALQQNAGMPNPGWAGGHYARKSILAQRASSASRGFDAPPVKRAPRLGVSR